MSARPPLLRSLAVAATICAATVVGGGVAGAHHRPPSAPAPSDPPPVAVTTHTGSLADGADWLIEVPANWNGTLLLYSHGLVVPGDPNPALDTPDPVSGRYLLDRGFALAGSSYADAGWAVAEALRDQDQVVDVFAAKVGTPKRTIAWGSSLGGMVTAGLLEQHPGRYAGGMSMCGVLAGSIGLWNSYLDVLFTAKTLIAPDLPVDLVHVTDPFGAIDQFRGALLAAQQTPEGRARIALAASIGDVPGWIGAGSPRPAPDDVTAQQAAQFEHLGTLAVFGLALRSEMEGRAGGNPSTNVGVDYRSLLRRSTGRAEVTALYRQAGMDLRADLDRLAAAPRISADPAAVAFVTENVTFDGDLHGAPLVTLHTAGDPLVGVEHDQAYASAARRAGNGHLVRQAFTERAGHCTFTPAETVATLQALLDRVQTGHWHHGTDAQALQVRAIGLGPDLNVHVEDDPNPIPIPTAPAFTKLRPGPFLRPFDRA